MPELLKDRPEARTRAIRDAAVALVSVIGVAAITWALENSGLIGAQFHLNESTVVTIVTLVGGMFGWRTVRPK